MAGIPVYTKQVDEVALPGAQQQSIASPALFAGSNAVGEAGAGLGSIAAAVQKHATDLQTKEDTATGTKLSAQFLNQITDFKIQARNRKGDLAAGLPEEADKFYSDSAAELIKTAPNERVKQYLTVFSQQQQPGFHGYIGDHAAQQLDVAQDAGFSAHISSLKNGAAVDPSTADANAADAAAAIKIQLNRKGITDPEQVEQAILKETTELHTGVISTLLVHNPTAAMAYFGTHKEEISGAVRAKVETQLKTTVDANDAIAGADTVWGKLGPKADGQPVQLDVMENEIRTMYKGDAAKIKDTISEVRSRAAAFNSSEMERTANVTNSVMDMYAKGATLTQLKATPEWSNLPGEKKASIQEHIENKIQAQQAHSDAVLARQDAAGLRADRAREKRGFSAYLAYSDPAILDKLTENQIIAMIPDIGEDKAGSLMTMKRTLANPAKLADAKADVDDFNQIASTMGLKPFGKKQTEDEKAALGNLRFKVENLIQSQQDIIKRPLSRVEKNDIMRNEAARAVTVDGGWFGSDKQVPVIRMSPAQVDKLIISPAERKTAADRLQQLHTRFPDNPRFQPNERNLRMMHLESVSPAADYIDGN